MSDQHTEPADRQDEIYPGQDDYTELHLDDATYGDFDWDDLDPEIVERHDTILDMDTEALEALDPEALDDFQRWAAARAWLGHDNPTRFIELSRRVLDTTTARRSKLLSYPDIILALARALAAENQLPRAMTLLEEYKGQEGADPIEHARHHGLLLLESGEEGQGLRVLLDAIETFSAQEPDLGLHLAEDLIELDHKPQARAILEAAREVAQTKGDPELLQEVEDTLSVWF